MTSGSEKLEAMPEDWERALAVVAHPDDLEYGAAAAISRWTSDGKDVAYLLATRGEAGIDGMAPEQCARVREDEQLASAAVVGVRTVEFLDHRDGVIEDGLPLRRDLAAAIRRHRPELLITLNHRETWGHGPGAPWNTPDHRIVGRAVLDAAGDAGNRWIFPDAGDPWGGVRWVAVAGSPYPTHAVAVSEDLGKAVDSLAEHRAYISGLGVSGDPREYARSFIERMLLTMGERMGTRHAVGFELYPR